MVEYFKFFISNLSFEQLLAVAHISSSIFIFILLPRWGRDIIIIIYSDYLIKYLRLEKKYPKIARIIQMRRMFQHSYLIINILLIIITLICTIYMNIQIFITY